MAVLPSLCLGLASFILLKESIFVTGSFAWGHWNGWNAWNVCSRTCGRGTQSRSRTCSYSYSQGIGIGCPYGQSQETRSCNTNSCYSEIGKNIFGPKSSCGGSTPWKCPYITFRATHGCSEMSITGPEECKTAAETLGYFGTLHEVRDTSRPSGCSVGKGPMDKSFNQKWDQIYFNRDPVGYLYSRAHRSICHNRVQVEGLIGVGRDFPLQNAARKELGSVEDVSNGKDRCCQECWALYPGTQMFEYHKGETPYFSWTRNDVCICLYKEPGKTLTTAQVDSSHVTGSCAHEFIVSQTTCQTGDNVGGTERFIQWEEYHLHDSCEEVCKYLHPSSIGITESKEETYWYSWDTRHEYKLNKKKCWCEFGPTPVIVKDSRYRTCLFNKQKQA